MPKPNWANGVSGAVQGGTTGYTMGGPVGGVIGAITGGVSGTYSGGGGGSGKSNSTKARSMGEMRGNPNPQSGSWFSGTDPVDYQQTTLAPEQIPLYEQSVNAGLRKGAGGAFGDSADYYRNLLSDDSEDYNAFARPEMRRFNEQIIPDLSEQFAGMGSGGLSSSGFRNATVNAGTDLSERLGKIRADLRMQGAQGLFQSGQQGLNQYLENVHVPGQPGMLQGMASGLGQAAGQFAGNYMSNKSGGGGAASTANSGSSGGSGNQSLSRGYTGGNVPQSQWGTAR